MSPLATASHFFATVPVQASSCQFFHLLNPSLAFFGISFIWDPFPLVLIAQILVLLAFPRTLAQVVPS